MSKKKARKKVIASSSTKPKKNIKSKNSNKGFLDTLDSFIAKNEKWVLTLITLIASFVYLLLFDIKISIGGDDAAYISRGFAFINKGLFPASQGPLYPIVLGFFIKLFGINIPVLKLVSFVFCVLHVVLFYKAFKGVVSPIVVTVTCFLVGLNSYIAFYASSTYSEAFFLFMSSLLFLVFFKYYFKTDEENKSVSKLVLVGFLVFLLSQIRFVGLAAIVALAFFFVTQKQFKKALIAFGSFSGFFLLLSLFKKVLNIGGGMSNQLSVLMKVHPYDYSKGEETLSGFVQRFFDNADIYIGKAFLVELGLRPETAEVASLMTIVVGALFVVGLFLSFRHNKAVFFTGLFVAALAGLTFIVLQAFWKQSRLVVILYPFLYLFFLSTIYFLFKHYLPKAFQFGFLVIAAILILTTLSRTGPKIQDNTLVLQKNLGKDPLYGYSPDWINFITASKWVSKNLPDSSKAACRKPNMAFIFSNGKTFHGIRRVNSKDADELLAALKEGGVTHVLRASLRLDGKKNTGQVINTVHRYMALIEQKYPGTFRSVYKTGNSESAVIFKINYPN